MPAIIKIGFEQYLLRNDAAGFAAIKALNGAVKVDPKWTDHESQFTPRADSVGLELTLVKPSQVKVKKSAPIGEISGKKP